jgi:hypothetical protein
VTVAGTAISAARRTAVRGIGVVSSESVVRRARAFLVNAGAATNKVMFGTNPGPVPGRVVPEPLAALGTGPSG